MTTYLRTARKLSEQHRSLLQCRPCISSIRSGRPATPVGAHSRRGYANVAEDAAAVQSPEPESQDGKKREDGTQPDKIKSRYTTIKRFGEKMHPIKNYEDMLDRLARGGINHRMKKLPPKEWESVPYLQEEMVYEGQPDFSKTLPFPDIDTFPRRHIGPDANDIKEMLGVIGESSLDSFVKSVVPEQIREGRELDIAVDRGMSESAMVKRFRKVADMNVGADHTNMIGLGYYGTKTPEVIKRNILESPAWYTSYTPYQPEISQGRLESLINFQTMVTSLTGMDIANASVLDELTAASEAMTFSYACLSTSRQKSAHKTFLVSDKLFPQTIAGLYPRAEGFGIKLVVTDLEQYNLEENAEDDIIGAMVQYPDTNGQTGEWLPTFTQKIHDKGGILCCATDLLALTLLEAPGEWGADVVFGNAQRFGVPMGFGGPHAAFFATKEAHKRKLPGRLVGASKDRLGDRAYRLALQTREQHIRREKATSNICTAQALLANMSAMYAIYHGPKGLKRIADRIVMMKRSLVEELQKLGYKEEDIQEGVLDTIVIKFPSTQKRDLCIKAAAAYEKINILPRDTDKISFSIDETTEYGVLRALRNVLQMIVQDKKEPYRSSHPMRTTPETFEINKIPEIFRRKTPYLEQEVFNSYHSETEMLRYIHHLQSKDLSLTHSMIPLGSCTMKLNATTEMLPLSWPEFANLHPFQDTRQTMGYRMMIRELEDDLANITGFSAVTLQPNSGAQGEFTGLRIIREYLKSKGEEKRNIILIPVSAHGTNPASATMVGYKVVSINCDKKTGNLDIEDMKAKAEKHKDSLAGVMITYPSTFGVFEPAIKEACQIVHDNGGQVYMDGANMNAQIGLKSPGFLGADVCHLNLHKTFCIPHGGGGPGVGPVCVAKHLVPFLPAHPAPFNHKPKTITKSIGPVAAAPFGSASILPISYGYIKMMGGPGLTHATKVTLLNANYMAKRLSEHYKILYTNDHGRCAHEFILDPREFKETTGIEAIDIAKRLMDYGFHAPTMSWPVAGTLMIEPTESESKAELDRYCDALIEIRKEIAEVEEGKVGKEVNLLKMAPHPLKDLLVGEEEWKERGYSRERAAFPIGWLREKKFWPSVARIDDAYGDQNLFCTCDPVAAETLP